MRSRLTTQISLLCVTAILVLNSLGAPKPSPAAPDGTKTAKQTKPVVLKWHSSIEKASAVAATQYRPVFVLFSAPGCSWCHRLKREVLASPAIRKLLTHFSLALVDIVDDPNTAKTYGVTSVPRILILSANGTVRADYAGYLPPQDLQKLLTKIVNPSLISTLTPTEKELSELIAANKVPENRWPEIMLILGTSSGKKALRTHILAMKPFPYNKLIALLNDSRLAVRLGTLELLEEVCGRSFGFDPWLDLGSAKTNQAAVNAFRTFFTKEKINEKKRFSGLSAKQIDVYIRDVISNDRKRSFRAMRMLQDGGETAAVAVAEFLKSHPQLAPGMRRRIKELQYSLYIPAVSGIDPARTAHQLVFGTLDIRLQAIARLKALGNRSVPILRELLADPDPIIREACIDTISVSGQRRTVIATFKDHLKTETDTEVIYAILKGLAQFRSRSGLAILVEYLGHKNEDLATIAIKSITRLKTHEANAQLTKCLSDPRWRIRVAALEAVGKLKIKTAENQVISLLKDKDNFVCNKAIETLASLDSKKSAKHLEKIFLENDEMKAPAVAGLTSMDKPLPASILPALKKSDSDIIVAVLMSMGHCSVADLTIPAHFAGHKDLDVSCSAIRILAARGIKVPKYRAIVAKALESNDSRIVQAAVAGIDLDSDDLKQFGISFAPREPELKTNERTVEDELYDAFLEKPGKEPKKVTSDDVFDEFVGDPAETQATKTDNTVAGLIAKLETVVSSKHKDNIKMTAALTLAEMGNPKPLEYINARWNTCTTGERERLMDEVSNIKSEKLVPLLTKALNDPAEAVRESAAKASWATRRKSAVAALLNELQRKGTRLTPAEAYTYSIEQATRRKSVRTELRKHVIAILGSSTSAPPLKCLALVLLNRCQQKDDLKLLVPLFKHPDPFVRRAAYWTYGKIDRKAFEAILDQVLNDSSEFVRAVIPGIYTYGDTQWTHYFSKTSFESDHHSWNTYYNSRRKPPVLPEPVEKALRKLTADSSGIARIESFFSLLSYKKKVDLARLVDTLDTFPDQKAVGDRIAAYMEDRIPTLGREFKVLYPYLARSGSTYVVEKAKAHFKIKEDEERLPELTFITRKDTSRKIEATFVNQPTEARPVAPDAPLKVVYFTSAGCDDCARTKRLLADLKEVFPRLIVQTYDIRSVKAMRYNEALCERFKVPERVRLITPAVFASGGFQVKSDITFSSLGKLLSRSRREANPGWDEVKGDELKIAEEKITGRFATIGLVFIAAAGLLDGINPCAFATIIFLLSYLRIARREPREIAQIGAAFIIGVFLAYFSLGLGMVEIITRFSVLQKFGYILNWTVGLLALVLMVLSMRDAVLCMQGRMKDINLQLPGFLKQGIHAAIRRGARHRHFVIAAFVVGVVISFLELACTGQVYAPTVLYMLKTGQERLTALGYLGIYNLAFVAPLFIIFILSYQGMTNDTLRKFFEKHSAAVKFMTALLFLGLFVFLVLGNKLGV